MNVLISYHFEKYTHWFISVLLKLKRLKSIKYIIAINLSFEHVYFQQFRFQQICTQIKK